MSLVSNDELRPEVAGSGAPDVTGGDTWGQASGHSDRRRRWPAFVVIGSVLAIGAAGAVYVLNQDDPTDTPTTEAAAIRVVEAAQRDLIEYEELAASMVYADLRSVTAEQPATVTAITEPGASLVRGDVVVELDGQPVVLFYGDVPLYRVLAVGAEGDDVLVLEQNLASLGHHTELDEDDNEVATGFTVDGVFDEATQDAVIRWQDDLGVAQTGEVSPGSAIVAPGSIEIIDTPAELGDRVPAGADLVEYTRVGTATAFYGEHDGEIDLEVSSGDVIVGGDVLYTVDERPVIAVVDSADVEFDRDLSLGVDDGDDIEVVETMLVDLGYDAGGDLEVDDEFTEETAEALTDFWDDLADRYDDLEASDELLLDDIVVVAPNTTVGAPTAHDADILAAGTELWSAESGATERIVTTELAVADQEDLQLGQAVEIEFPDGSVVTGTVSDVARTSVLDPMAPDADPVLPIEISVDDIPESAAAFTELDVTVLVADRVAENAVVVPVTALVAIGDGNYAVEVVTADGTTQFVAVEVGMFADGEVEVSGIDVGQSVVVP